MGISRTSVLKLVVAALVAALGPACDLNPQPLPPDNPGDAAFVGTVPSASSDASSGTPDSGADTLVDASSPDSSVVPPPSGEGGPDGDTDAAPSDAAIDAPLDSSGDAENVDAAELDDAGG